MRVTCLQEHLAKGLSIVSRAVSTRSTLPVLANVLKQHGANNYNIFLNKETSQLFAYVEIEDEVRWNAVAETDICREWWAYMKDIMPSNPDNSPISSELTSVFYLA